MFRIDADSNTNSLPTPLPPGTPGYFRQASDGTQTQLTNDWANLVQEALCRTIEKSGIPLLKTDFDRFAKSIQTGVLNYAVTTNTGNNYAATLNPAPFVDGTDFIEGAVYRVRVNATNTGVVTINFNSIGAIGVKTFGDFDLLPGEWKEEMVAQLLWDGSKFILLNPNKINIVASVYANSAQTIPGGNTPELLHFDAIEFDPLVLWTATPDYRFTSKKAGYYRATGRYFVGTNTSGANFYIELYKNGTIYKRLCELTWSGNNLTPNGSTMLYLDVGDYISLYGVNDAGPDVVGGSILASNSFEIEYIGA